MSVEAFARILSCAALVVATAAAAPAGTATPQPVMAQPKAQAQPSAPHLCVDGMETEPDYDDLDPTPVSDTVDGGCLTSLDPIST